MNDFYEQWSCTFKLVHSLFHVSELHLGNCNKKHPRITNHHEKKITFYVLFRFHSINEEKTTNWSRKHYDAYLGDIIFDERVKR